MAVSPSLPRFRGKTKPDPSPGMFASLPEQMDLEQIYLGTRGLRPISAQSYRFAARIMAEAMKMTGIRVTASADIGGSFPTGASPIFTHRKCKGTSLQSQFHRSVTLENNAQELCGEHAIVLLYLASV